MHRVRTFPLVAMVAAVLVATLAAAAVPASAKVATTPTVKAAPSKNLQLGQVVEVSGKGWPADASLEIVECNANVVTGDPNACLSTAVVAAHANAKGQVAPTGISFTTGTIGDGSCDGGQVCYLDLTEPGGAIHALAKVTVAKKATTAKEPAARR